MKLMKRKTRKAIEKNLRKALKNHGPAIAAGLIGGIASTLAAFAADDDKPKRDSALSGLSKKGLALFEGKGGKRGKSRRKGDGRIADAKVERGLASERG